ncbi:MAG: hypothetical protein LBQ18_03320 [Campylobacteraceae bacterium]|jgi:hypothetical protein|nr:hypothetical protein [Campylobacteraceae bacterium]
MRLDKLKPLQKLSKIKPLPRLSGKWVTNPIELCWLVSGVLSKTTNRESLLLAQELINKANNYEWIKEGEFKDIMEHYGIKREWMIQGR